MTFFKNKLFQKLVAAEPLPPISFQTRPDQYRHWKLEVEGHVARLVWKTQEDAPIRPGYRLNLNNYDLGVDIELADAIDRIRFEQPQVKVVVITSGLDGMFSSGANIYMLRSSAHGFKINFCKFTNETRLAIEEASAESGIKFLAALNGMTAGGGYELAMACDQILMIDDASSAVSLPEVALLGVLPGTGGLTRLVDKRHVRRDYADILSTLGTTGVKAAKALAWKLVDFIAPRSRFAERVHQLSEALAAEVTIPKGERGVPLDDVVGVWEGNTLKYHHVTLKVNRTERTAELIMNGPSGTLPATADEIVAQGSNFWMLRAFRELDDAMLQLRFNLGEIGVVSVKTRGNREAILAMDRLVTENRDHWFVEEVVLKAARTLRRMDMTSKSFVAVMDRESCFAGSLLELALASDRSFILDDEGVSVQASFLNSGAFPMHQGISRLSLRYLDSPDKVAAVLERSRSGPVSPQDAVESRFASEALDELDFEDEVPAAITERASLSPDALTGMEMNFRLSGPQTLATKIFGLLSAWQNWVFRGTNAVGPTGGLTAYGSGSQPVFDSRRT